MPLKEQSEPNSANPMARRLAFAIGTLVVLMVYGTASGAVQNVWHAITGYGMPIAAPNAVPVSKPILSEHNREWIETLGPQQQMEALIQSAINHEEGSTALIAQKLDSWHGHLERTRHWDDLMMTALYSNDLRVRAAAMEINLAANHLDKTSETVDSLIQKGEDEISARPYSAWNLGMLANRGVAAEKITPVLQNWMHDPNEQSRIWAVEGLAQIGTDETIKDFLWALKNDQSPQVRERAGCSLAKSGMLTRVQRMHAVPGLIDMADDSSLAPQTRNWVFQALREITDEILPNESGQWRNWWLEKGQERIQKFATADPDQTLGNS